MHTDSIVPLIATIAYIPLFIILLTNRPWGSKHRLFLLFLIPAALWSFTTFLSRSALSHYEATGVNIVICLLIWMLVQLHYFIRSFYQFERVKIPLAYIFLITSIILIAAPIHDYLKPTVEAGVVDYGYGIIVIGLLFLFFRSDCSP